MRYLGYEVCLLACRIAGVPDRQCNAFHRAQTCQPEGDSRSGFLPAGLPSFPVPRRAQRLLVFSFDYSACGQPIASSDLAAYCSASSARAEFLQRVRRLLTGGSLRPACARRLQPPRITIPRRAFTTVLDDDSDLLFYGISVDDTVLLMLSITLIYSGIGIKSFFFAAIFLPTSASL